MAARFQSSWYDIDGQQYRLTIHDDNYAGASVEQTLEGAVPGFELVYESEDDQPYQGIIASTLTFHLVNEGGSFDTWLQSIPSLTGENDVTVTLERDFGGGWALEWAGVIMVDQIEIEDMPTPSRVKLVANDGTAFLKTVRTVETTTTSSGVTILASQGIITWLCSILDNTKTAQHWNTQAKFLRAWTDLHPENWGDADPGGLGSVGLDVLTQSSLTGAMDPNSINVVDGTGQPYTQWTFLQSLCMLFNARLCLANGEWHFWPVNQHMMQADGAGYTYFHKVYNRSAALLSENLSEKGEFYSRTTPQLGPATTSGRYVQMAGGTISHTIPLKNFRRTRPYRALEWLNNSIRVGGGTTMQVSVNGLGLVDFDAPQSFFAGATFLIDGSVQVGRAAQGGASGPADVAQLRLKLNLDVEGYRYNPNTNAWITDQTTDQYFFLGQLGNISDGFDVSMPFSIATPGLPADSETLQCEIDADFISGVGTSLNTQFSGTSPQTYLGCFITTSLTNDAYENKLVFQGETSLDNTEAFNQGTLVFGTVDSIGSNSGQLNVYSAYQGAPQAWDMSTWVSHFSTADPAHLNRLCVREAIGLLQSGLPKRSGQIRIPSGARIPSPLMTIQNEEGTAHFMVTACSYSADERIANISRLQIGALDLTNVSDNGDEGDPAGDDENDGSGGGSGGGATDDGGTSDGGSGTGSGPGGGIANSHINQFAQLTEQIQFDKDGIIKIQGKSGQLPIDADIIDDSTSTNKFTSQGEKDDISDLIATIKTTTGSGGKGVFVNSSKDLTESHVSVDGTTAVLQAGTNTQVDMSETSPGSISFKVQAGSSGNETAVEAMSIDGNASLQQAAVTFPSRVIFNATTSGLSSTNVGEGSNLYFTDARADARIAAASAADLSDVTSAGSGAIITSAERTKLSGIETGAEANVVTTNLGSADQTVSGTRNINLGASGQLKVKASSGNSLTPLSIEANSNNPATIRINGDLRLDSGALSGGLIKLEENPMGGSNFVALQAPGSLSSDVTFTLPAADGSSGQFIKTDGSGNLSFASASGGGSSESYITLQSSFYTGDANGDYIPIGGTLTETTSFQYYNQWIAPLAGEVVNARIFTSGSSAGASNLHFRKYNSSTNLDTASATFTTNNQVRLFEFDAATFSAGDRCAFFFDPAGVPAGVSVTILIKLTHP